jgi:hypothetical protein
MEGYNMSLKDCVSLMPEKKGLAVRLTKTAKLHYTVNLAIV